MYGEQLKPYYSLFDRKQIRVWLYEDLISDPARMMREMFAFLEVEESFHPNLSQKHNVTRIPLRRWFPWLPAPKPDFPRDVRERLRAAYREDLLLAEELIGRDLSMWRGEG
jgi:hypothetical protein